MKKENMEQIKTFMFQYAFDNGIHCAGFCHLRSTKIVEDTNLITEKEANELWDKYYPEVVKRLQNNENPQMCVWRDCTDSSHYTTIEKEIDWRDDLEIKNGKIYKKTLIEL